jgi:hypothetical protein
MIEAEDLMQKHWDFECSDPLADFGRERVALQHGPNPFRASFQGKYHDYDRVCALADAYFDSVRKSGGTFQ